MYFTSIEVENIKCFGKRQTLNLSDANGHPSRWTIILGDNGIGKTTLLQSLIWMRTVEAPPASGSGDRKNKASKVSLKPIMDDLEDNTLIFGLIRQGRNIKSQIVASYSINFGFSPAKMSKADRAKLRVGMDLESEAGKLKTVQPIMGKYKSYIEPMLFAYSASRHMVSQNIDSHEIQDPVYNFLSNDSELYDAEQVLNNLEHHALKNRSGNVASLLPKVKKLLADLLPDINSPEDIEIGGPKVFGGHTGISDKSGVRLRMPYGSIPIHSLSLGYKTMLSWAVDLALRLLQSNPLSESPLEEPAIVIIDEIDLHLHPKWQRDVRNFLCDHFPNVQFICTAHSVFMAQASERDNIAVLKREGDHVVIVNDLQVMEGWRIDQLATSEVIGVPSARSSNVSDMIEERKTLLSKKRKSRKDKDRLLEIDKVISNLPSQENHKNNELIRRATELLSGKIK